MGESSLVMQVSDATGTVVHHHEPGDHLVPRLIVPVVTRGPVGRTTEAEFAAATAEFRSVAGRVVEHDEVLGLSRIVVERPRVTARRVTPPSEVGRNSLVEAEARRNLIVVSAVNCSGKHGARIPRGRWIAVAVRPDTLTAAGVELLRNPDG
jgi:hypothetical protein